MGTLQLATPPPLAHAAASAIFSQVLFAIDFGTASLGGARWAITNVVPGADAALAHVMPFVDVLPCGDPTTIIKHEPIERVRPALAGGLGGFAATLGLATSRAVVRSGRPSACLTEIANDVDATLLVLGRRSDANRLRVGEPNVIERTARRTSASVLVVPEGTSVAPEHVIAAVDESRYAPHVLRMAARLARMHEVPLTVLHVLSPVEGAYERVIRSAKHVLADARGRSRTAPERSAIPASLPPSTTRWLVQLGRDHDVIGRDSVHVALGDPAREIVRTAAERGTSVVVVGMRGADEAVSGSIGSVARELLTRGPVPVLAVSAS